MFGSVVFLKKKENTEENHPATVLYRLWDQSVMEVNGLVWGLPAELHITEAQRSVQMEDRLHRLLDEATFLEGLKVCTYMIQQSVPGY